jgi:beta-lactamase regulating signal transducer with metallopeptidase domain
MMIASDLLRVFGSFDAEYCRHLTQALVHFLWQGCALAIVYAVAARGLRRAPANVRYVVGVTALLAMAACLPITLWVVSAANTDAPQPVAASRPRPEIVATVPARVDAAVPAEKSGAGLPRAAIPYVGRSAEALPTRSRVVAAPSLADRATDWLRRASPYTTAIYLCGVAVMLLRMAMGFWGGRRLRRACAAVCEGPTVETLRRHARRLGLRVVPVLAYCGRISAPVVLGVLRPTILLPAALASGLTAEQFEAVLLHELAHIRRFDLVVNVVQRLIESLLFFHPAVWWLSRRVSLERENACDDLVLRSNCPRTTYADALVRVAEICSRAGGRDALGPAGLAASGGDASQFRRRVLRLLGVDSQPRLRLTASGIVAAASLSVFLVLAPLAWQGAAMSRDKEAKDDTPAASQLKAADKASEEPAEAPSEAEVRAKSLERIREAEKVLAAHPPEGQEKRIEAFLVILRNCNLNFGDEKVWAKAIRELILIGKPAVPKLIEELDDVKKGRLSTLGFVLRGIGDPRAVPALVRAIPRMLVPPSSDCGMEIKDDPELEKFMREHDNEHSEKWRGPPREKEEGYSLGRPINEIMPALKKMTGRSEGHFELCMVQMAEDMQRKRLQQQLYLRCARNWADWWAKNWRKHVANEKEAQLDLTRQALDRYAKTIPPAPPTGPTGFPIGANVKEENGNDDGCVQSFKECAAMVFFDWDCSGMAFSDLDTGRHPCPPKELVKRSPEDGSDAELLAWAEREGVDLINVKIKPAGDKESHYAFLPVGMKVWQIENEEYRTFVEQLQSGTKPKLSEPWKGPLVQIDKISGKIDDDLIASFVFITREGSCGAIQLRPPLHEEPAPQSCCGPRGGLRLKFFYVGKAEQPKARPAAKAPTPAEIIAGYRRNFASLMPIAVCYKMKQIEGIGLIERDRLEVVQNQALLTAKSSLDKPGAVYTSSSPGMSDEQIRQTLKAAAREAPQQLEMLAYQLKPENVKKRLNESRRWRFQWWCDQQSFHVRWPKHQEDDSVELDVGPITPESLEKNYGLVQMISRCKKNNPPARFWYGMENSPRGPAGEVGKASLRTMQSCVSFPPLGVTVVPEWAVAMQFTDMDQFMSQPLEAYQVVGETMLAGRKMILLDCDLNYDFVSTVKLLFKNRARAWIDPRRGFLPIRLEYDYVPAGDSKRAQFPAKMGELSAFAEIDDVREVHGAFYPMSGERQEYVPDARWEIELIKKHESSIGKVNPGKLPGWHRSWRVTSFTANAPAEPGALELVFPKGTEIIDADAVQ